MIINQANCRNLQDLFSNAITVVFGKSDNFYDYLENEEYSVNYDCYINGSGENYIINRVTGEYVNWYKLYHLGRDISVSMSYKYTDDINNINTWILKFLKDFKNT